MRITELVSASTKEVKKYILPLSDIHYGSKTCDLDKLQGYIDWALDKNAWVILNGDLVENSNRYSVGSGNYEQELPPQEQTEGIVEILKPLTKKNQILGLITGNHEERTYKETGIDISSHMAQQLGVPYMRYSGMFKLKVREINYTVFATHGSAGSKFLKTKMGACEDLSKVAHADLYLMGHVHDLAIWSTDYFYVDIKNKQKKKGRKTFVITGTFQGYEGTYADMKNLIPGKLGAVRLRLDGRKKDVHGSI